MPFNSVHLNRFKSLDRRFGLLSALREGEGSTFRVSTRKGMGKRKTGKEQDAVQQRFDGQVCRLIMVVDNETILVCKPSHDWFLFKVNSR